MVDAFVLCCMLEAFVLSRVAHLLRSHVKLFDTFLLFRTVDSAVLATVVLAVSLTLVNM